MLGRSSSVLLLLGLVWKMTPRWYDSCGCDALGMIVPATTTTTTTTNRKTRSCFFLPSMNRRVRDENGSMNRRLYATSNPNNNNNKDKDDDPVVCESPTNNDDDDDATNSPPPSPPPRWQRLWNRLWSSSSSSNNNNRSSTNTNRDMPFPQDVAIQNQEIDTPDRSTTPPKTTVRTVESESNNDSNTKIRHYQDAAAKARLEAEQMEAALTLSKITKLETQLNQIQRNHKHPENEQDLKDGINQRNRSQQQQQQVEQLQQQLAALKLKLASPFSASDSKYTSSKTRESTSTPTTRTLSFEDTELAQSWMQPYNETAFQERLKNLEQAPEFIVKTMAASLGINTTGTSWWGNSADQNVPQQLQINRTRVAQKMDALERNDFTDSPKTPPSFTQAQIQVKRDELLDEQQKGILWLPGSITLEAAQGNMTKLAVWVLEYEYYSPDEQTNDQQFMETLLGGEEWFSFLNNNSGGLGMMQEDDVVGSMLYPSCTRERSPKPSPEDMQRVFQVLPKTNFQPNAKWESIPNGYIVRGTVKNESMDVIESIESQLGRPLADKVTVLYTPDVFTMATADAWDDPSQYASLPPILYIVGPTVTREPRPGVLSLVSASGLATAWYLSIYPFLFNSKLADRVDQDLALVDTGMQPDLTYLTDLSVPLFASFMGILLAHELGHSVAAGIHQFNISVPTFVPSIITGVTGTVTTFKSLPKNRNAMFDFSLAGPVTGMVASLIALGVGSQFTVAATDASSFPALPLEVLRQSTLGGGIIESILGNGVLSLPEGALGTAAVAGITIPLHPLALAGFIGLLVNALSLLPIGTTDGGRVTMTLLGRPAKIVVGQVAMVILLLLGTLGSDLFLFYFAFCLAFQSGNEVPAKNEVDPVDLSRIVLATGAYLVAALALVPFQ